MVAAFSPSAFARSAFCLLPFCLVWPDCQNCLASLSAGVAAKITVGQKAVGRTEVWTVDGLIACP